jgi:hypothetical protein
MAGHSCGTPASGRERSPRLAGGWCNTSHLDSQFFLQLFSATFFSQIFRLDFLSQMGRSSPALHAALHPLYRAPVALPHWQRRRNGHLMVIAPCLCGRWHVAIPRRYVARRRAEAGLARALQYYSPEARIVEVKRVFEAWDVLAELQGKSPADVARQELEALEKRQWPPVPDYQLFKRRRAKMSATEKSELGRRLAAARWGTRS